MNDHINWANTIAGLEVEYLGDAHIGEVKAWAVVLYRLLVGMEWQVTEMQRLGSNHNLT